MPVPPGMRMWLLVWLVIGWASSGCTLLGAGVGAGIDAASPGPYESKPVGSQLQLEHGDDIILLMDYGLRREGEFVGLHGPTKRDPEIYMLLEGGYGVQSVPLSDVRSIAVDASGNGWIYGGAIGLVADIVVVVVAAEAMANSQMDLSRSDMDWGK